MMKYLDCKHANEIYLIYDAFAYTEKNDFVEISKNFARDIDMKIIVGY